MNTVKKLRFSCKTGHSFGELRDCKIGKHVSAPWSQMFETVVVYDAECVMQHNYGTFVCDIIVNTINKSILFSRGWLTVRI